MSKTSMLTCIMCPTGCRLQVTCNQGEVCEVKGHACPRGETYARQEVQTPQRTVISVVRCSQGRFPTVSVKTAQPVPKAAVPAVMQALRDVQVNAPVAVGDVIVSNVCNLEVDVVATRSVRRSDC